MTAEVAILNKLAVALAADSAVTVGQGGESKKVFNTADKLFELSCKQPIACMIFSGGQFLQAPLPVLIKDFRSKDPDADKVSDVATALLAHFQTFAEASPIEVKTRPIFDLTWQITDFLSDRLQEQVSQRFDQLGKPNPETGEPITPDKLLDAAWDATVKILERIAAGWTEVSFLGSYPDPAQIRPLIEQAHAGANFQVPEAYQERVFTVIDNALRKATGFSSLTGVVVAGFGK
jgi:hypothetical protein